MRLISFRMIWLFRLVPHAMMFTLSVAARNFMMGFQGFELLF